MSFCQNPVSIRIQILKQACSLPIVYKDDETKYFLEIVVVDILGGSIVYHVVWGAVLFFTKKSFDKSDD